MVDDKLFSFRGSRDDGQNLVIYSNPTEPSKVKRTVSDVILCDSRYKQYSVTKLGRNFILVTGGCIW